MSSASTQRSFPNEVFGVILSHADRGTVAVCSRVCLAFLEYSGPLLYKHVVLDRDDQAGKLFCRHRSAPSEATARNLSLSQIHTLTINADTSSFVDQISSRNPDGRPLPIHRLVLGREGILSLDAKFVGNLNRQNPISPFHSRWISVDHPGFLASLDPLEFVVEQPTSIPRPSIGVVLALERGRLLEWPRLRHLTYIGCHVLGSLRSTADTGLRACPYSSETATITYDLSATAKLDVFIDMLWYDSGEGIYRVGPLRVTAIIVATEQDARWFETKLRAQRPDEHGQPLALSLEVRLPQK